MIVIPMAGMSSRFFKAGYTEPKYMLKAHGKTLFNHAVCSFESYFSSEPFLFIIRDVYNTKEFVSSQAKELGIENFSIYTLETETRGQAETVALAIEELDDNEPLTIFNIDTFRPNFSFPEIAKLSDGYLEVFLGNGNNWSFVKPVNEVSTQVIQTAEKNPISDLCCTGLYHFERKNDYIDAYNNYLAKPQCDWEKGELYVAPLYNYLIKKGKKIHYFIIEKNNVVFCGVPSEYIDFLNN